MKGFHQAGMNVYSATLCIQTCSFLLGAVAQEKRLGRKREQEEEEEEERETKKWEK